MSTRERAPIAVFIMLASALLCVRGADAQQRSPKPAAGRTAAPSADAASRSEIINGQPWRRTTTEFRHRLSQMPIYDAKQLDMMKSAQTAKVAKMSAGELQAMLNDVEAKNQILASEPAQDAIAWLGQIFAEYTPKGLEKQFGLKGVPNFAAMTAPQLSAEIIKIQKMQDDYARSNAGRGSASIAQGNPWDPGAKAAQQAYVQDHDSTSTSYTSPYRSAPTSKPFADVKTGPAISFSVGTFGGFRMNYNTASF